MIPSKYWKCTLRRLYTYYFYRSFRRRRLLGLILAFVLTSIIWVWQVQERKDHFVVGESMHEILSRHSNQACVHPQLKLFPPEFKSLYRKLPKLICTYEENWVSVKNGTFLISTNAEKRNGKIICEYTPISFGEDDFTLVQGTTVKPMLNGTKIGSDVFKAVCKSSNGRNYVNVHSGVAYSEKYHKRLEQRSKKKNDKPQYDVLMIGFDSVSAMAWQRFLPKSHDYFVNHLGAIVLGGYNIVGDGTPQALLPILTGKTEEELPEARRGKPNAQTVDSFPWIWKSYEENGYVTQFNEDEPQSAAFALRMLGFEKQPTDHYMRPFHLATRDIAFQFQEYCLGPLKKHLILFNSFRDMYSMYRKHPKFMFGFHTELSHDDNNNLQLADNDLYKLLLDLYENGSLDRTILILMADHGSRISRLRASIQGKLEERMPFFGIRLPPSFDRYYPESRENLKINSFRLTTPFDIHATFQDLLNFTTKEQRGPQKRGSSLFKEIPKNRTCKSASIEPHWCACLSWTNINVAEPMAEKAAMAVVDFINAITSEYREDCSSLKLQHVVRLMKYSTNSEVVDFKKSSDRDGRTADFSDKITSVTSLYQVTFFTTPGNGEFEATINYFVEEKRFTLTSKDISRINKYGNDPHCIVKKNPFLRPFCYCDARNVH